MSHYPLQAVRLHDEGVAICPLSSLRTALDRADHAGADAHSLASAIFSVHEAVDKSNEVHFPGKISSGTSWALQMAIGMKKVELYCIDS